MYVKDTCHGPLAYEVRMLACANAACKEVQVNFWLGSPRKNNHGSVIGVTEPLEYAAIRPAYASRPQPSYIPLALREDYTEACKIKALSPKASATLARRCLQGMIRDFCGISKNRLIDEINELRKRVDDEQTPPGVTIETVEAIDHVREVGNIGAHMEKDINLIIDVDEGEAQALIELVEMLFDEWYVARRKRQDRLEKVKELALAKANAKKPPQEPDDVTTE